MASWTKYIAVLFLCFGCEEQPQNQKELGTVKQRKHRQSDNCDDLIWNYTNVGKPFLMSWCTSCHHSDLAEQYRAGATVGVDLETYALVQQYSDRILARATGETPTMPPAGGPTTEEIERFQQWLECGAPE